MRFDSIYDALNEAREKGYKFCAEVDSEDEIYSIDVYLETYRTGDDIEQERNNVEKFAIYNDSIFKLDKTTEYRTIGKIVLILYREYPDKSPL